MFTRWQDGIIIVMSRLSFITNIEQFYIDLLKTSQDENGKKEIYILGNLESILFLQDRVSLWSEL